VHVVRDHQAADISLGNDFFRECQHLIGCAGVERGGMLIQEQKLRRYDRRHQKRQRLALSSGEKPDRIFHAVL
jgi:hypothetical protein